MAFVPANLVAMSHMLGTKQMFYYESTEAGTVLDDDDYFLPAQDKLPVGCIIMCRASTGGTATFHALAIQASTTSTVTTINLTATA